MISYTKFYIFTCISLAIKIVQNVNPNPNPFNFYCKTTKPNLKLDLKDKEHAKPLAKDFISSLFVCVCVCVCFFFPDLDKNNGK